MSNDQIAQLCREFYLAGGDIHHCKPGRYRRSKSRRTLASRPTRAIYGYQGS